MPKGAGVTYDYIYLYECIKDVLVNELESGDLFNSRSISFFLSQYKGLSKNDKMKEFILPMGTLMSSKAYFMRIANTINRDNANNIFQKKYSNLKRKMVCGNVQRGTYYKKY